MKVFFDPALPAGWRPVIKSVSCIAYIEFSLAIQVIAGNHLLEIYGVSIVLHMGHRLFPF